MSQTNFDTNLPLTVIQLANENEIEWDKARRDLNFSDLIITDELTEEPKSETNNRLRLRLLKWFKRKTPDVLIERKKGKEITFISKGQYYLSEDELTIKYKDSLIKSLLKRRWHAKPDKPEVSNSFLYFLREYHRVELQRYIFLARK